MLVHGTFDLLHLGHVRLFREAKRLAERLIVTITSDAYVNKGPGRPLFNEYERLEMVRACRYVDQVEIVREKTGVSAIRKWKPLFYVKGADYRTEDKNGALEIERIAVEQCGGELLILDLPLTPSSILIEKVSKWKELNDKALPGPVLARR